MLDIWPKNLYHWEMRGGIQFESFGAVQSVAELNPHRLYFPYQLVEAVGQCRRSIAYMKKKGCKFYGRKTKLLWINEFLEEQAKALSPV